MELESSLLGDFSRKLCENELVPGRHRYAVSILVSFVQCFLDASSIIDKQSSLLHELNAAVLNDCTALRAVVEHGHLEVRFRVEDRNGRVDWIVVAGDFLVRGEVEGGALVNDPLLHL